MTESIPLIEFDPDRVAMVEPARVVPALEVAAHCVICFFPEVIEKVRTGCQARLVAENRWEDGSHPLYEISHSGRRLAFFHPGVGSAAAAGLLEEVIARGCRKFIACGGCGVLETGLDVGTLVLVSAAIRDEGVSYHYLPAAREVVADAPTLAALERELGRKAVDYRLGKTWTTDAPYRETRAKVARRRGEGCLTVEMEAAAMMAVAKIRALPFGQILYAGDDLSGAEWDHRAWQSHTQVREDLFWLAAGVCLTL